MLSANSLVIEGEILPPLSRSLDSIEGVRQEMVSAYSSHLEGEVPAPILMARITALRAIAEAINVATIERKLAMLKRLQ